MILETMTRSGYTCIRYLFCWMNVLLWVTACGLLGIGVWLRISYEGYITLLPQHALLSADSLAIGIGAAVFVVAFLGCCGSWCQSRFLLILYFSLVVLTFLAEFLLGSAAFLFRSGIGHTLKEELRDGITHHYNANYTVLSGGAAGGATTALSTNANSLPILWDKIQSQLACCGVVNYEDWFMIDAWPQEKRVPDSCCVTPVARCGLTTGGGATAWWQRGCADQISLYMGQRLHVIGVVGLVFAFLQLFGLICSMLLFCTIKYRRRRASITSFKDDYDT